MIEITVLGTPQPAGSKRAFHNRHTGRIVVTDDAKKSRPWKQEVAGQAATAMNGQQLLRGPLALTVLFVVPRPKGHHGARGLRPSAPTHPAVRPDVTKLLRAVEDALNGVVWKDDAQVVRQVARKEYGEPARAEITIVSLTERKPE